MVKKVVLGQTLLFILLVSVYFVLQNETIYTFTFGKISRNHANINGERSMLHRPFLMVNNISYIQWDAVNYKTIKDHGYDIRKSGGDYIYAYFPLFPFVWRVLPIPPLGWLFVNFILYSAGLFLLLRLFVDRYCHWKYLLIFMGLPVLVVYLIPYTEALFFFLVSIGVYGLVKRNYLIYFMGLLLASMTRPTFSILLVAFLCAELLFLFDHRNFKRALLSAARNILPLIAGTFVVSFVQLLQGSGSPFKFAEVQSYWDHYFRLPSYIGDWSHESFGMNIAILALVFVPVVFALTRLVALRIRATNQQPTNISPEYYLAVLSAIYLIGGCLFILLFQGGCLNNLYRYTANTPFFYIVILTSWRHIESDSRKYRAGFFVLAILAVMAVTLLRYSNGWMYADYGVLGFIFFFALWIYQKYADTSLYKILGSVIVLLNVLWTCYLFNTYINNGWICI